MTSNSRGCPGTPCAFRDGETARHKPFSSQTGLRFNPGDIIVLYPTALGGGEEVVSYKATKVQETFETVEAGVKSYASRVKYGFAM